MHSEFWGTVIYEFDEDDTIPAIQAIFASEEKRIRLIKKIESTLES